MPLFLNMTSIKKIISVACFFFLMGCAAMPFSRVFLRTTPVLAETNNETYISADYRAYYHFMLGYQAEFIKDYETSLQEYVKALKYDPESFYLMYNIANILKNKGNIKYAISYMEKALKFAPNHKHGLMFLGDLYIIDSQSEKAIETLQRTQVIYPEERDAYFKEVKVYSEAEEYEKAKSALKRIIRKFSGSSKAYYLLGRINVLEELYDAGIKNYTKALKLNPRNLLAHLGKGMAYEAMGDNTKAIEIYAHILKTVDPDANNVLDRLISLYVSEKEYDKAVLYLDKLIDNSPHNLNAYVKKGLIYVDIKDYEKALEVWGHVINVLPDNLRFRNYLAYTYELMEEYEKALEVYEHMKEIDPYYSDTYLHMGYLQGKMKRYDDAEITLKEAIKLDPDRPEFYLYLGLVYMNKKELDKVEEVFNKGLDKDSANVELHFNLGVLYEKLDDMERLVEKMQTVLELNPGNTHAMNYIGYIYAVKGIHLDEALVYINKALETEPESGYFLDSLAWVYYKMKLYEDAEQTMRKAINSLHDDPLIHEHMGDILLELQKFDEAKDEWVKSLVYDPKNDKLIQKYIEHGFGDPLMIEDIKDALKKLEETEEESVKEVEPESFEKDTSMTLSL